VFARGLGFRNSILGFVCVWIVVMFCMVYKLPHLYSTRNTLRCNIIQTVPHVQCSVTDLNDVTEKDQIKYELRK